MKQKLPVGSETASQKNKEKIIIHFLIINNPTIMKTLTKISGALIIAALATGGTYFQNLKTKQYIYNDITLADLNAFLGSENNGSNPENGGGTDPETGGGNTETESGIKDWWNSKDYICVDIVCWETESNYKYTSNQSDRVATGTGTVAHSWDCKGCRDGYIIDPASLPK